MFVVRNHLNTNPMEEKKRSLAMQAVIYAIFVALAGVVFHLILFITDLYMNRTVSFFGIIISIAGMIWGTLEYRKNYLNGFISYGKAFTLCFLIGLFAGVISAIYMVVFAMGIHPSYTQEMMDQAREQMMISQPNLSEDEIDQAMAISEKFMSPLPLAIMAFFMNALYSAVLALLLGLILKKEDKSLAGSSPAV